MSMQSGKTAMTDSKTAVVVKPTANPTIKIASPRQSDGSDEITLADIDPIGRTEVLLYGPPGGTKTVTASTFPPPFRWLDADRGTKSLRWAVKEGISAIKDLEKDIKIFRPSEELDGQYPSRKPGIISAFDKMTDKMDWWFGGDVDNWNTLVIDSFTEINEWSLNKGLFLNERMPSQARPLSISERINLQAKFRILTGQQDYKSAMGLCEGFITDVRIECERHGKNLVVICHEWMEEREKDDGTMEVVRYLPLLIGQLRTRLPKSFDDVWYCQLDSNAKPPKATVQMLGDPRHYAKTRWGSIVERYEPADYRLLIAKVRAYHNG